LIALRTTFSTARDKVGMSRNGDIVDRIDGDLLTERLRFECRVFQHIRDDVREIE
jgi:hypothetical protein